MLRTWERGHVLWERRQTPVSLIWCPPCWWVPTETSTLCYLGGTLVLEALQRIPAVLPKLVFRLWLGKSTSQHCYWMNEAPNLGMVWETPSLLIAPSQISGAGGQVTLQLCILLGSWKVLQPVTLTSGTPFQQMIASGQHTAATGITLHWLHIPLTQTNEGFLHK